AFTLEGVHDACLRGAIMKSNDLQKAGFRHNLPILCGLLLCTLATQTLAKNTYTNKGGTCTPPLSPPPDIVWLGGTTTCTGGGVNTQNSYNFQTGVLVPLGAMNTHAVWTTLQGQPLVINGVEVQFVPSAAATMKVSSKSPAPAGKVWVGFQSTHSFPP